MAVRKRLSEALDEYLRIRQVRCSETTVKNEAFVLWRFIAGVGDLYTINLRDTHVTNWFYGEGGIMHPHRTRDHVLRPPVRPSTHNYYLTRLKSFFEFCARRGYLREDPLADVGRIKEQRRMRLQPPPDVLLRLLDCAANDRDRAYLATAINTALRQSELRPLRVRHVDLEHGSLYVDIDKTEEDDWMPITADLDGELRSWLTTYALDLGRPLIGDDYLFPAHRTVIKAWSKSDDGTRKPVRDVRWVPERPMSHPERVVQHALRWAGIPDTKGEGTHTLRRAVARALFDDLASQGYDFALRTVSAWLHHQSTTTTERYLGISSEKRRRDQALRGQPFLTRLVNDDNVVPLRRVQQERD